MCTGDKQHSVVVEVVFPLLLCQTTPNRLYIVFYRNRQHADRGQGISLGLRGRGALAQFRSNRDHAYAADAGSGDFPCFRVNFLNTRSHSAAGSGFWQRMNPR